MHPVSAERVTSPVPDDMEELLRAALMLDGQDRIEALAALWGPGWSQSACAREAGVDRGTIRNCIRKENIRPDHWIKIVDAFRKQRAQ